MRLALIENDMQMRENLNLLLRGEPGITVVGAFASAGEAMEGIGSISAEVLVVDLELPDMPGVELINRVKGLAPELDIMVYTMLDDRKTVFSAFKAGASGYMLKGSTPRELIEAVNSLYSGGAPMSPRIARMVIAEYHRNVSGTRNVLTRREKEILRGMDWGLTYREMAKELCISPHTVRTHIKKIYEKLHASNREEALLKARKKNAF